MRVSFALFVAHFKRFLWYQYFIRRSIIALVLVGNEIVIDIVHLFVGNPRTLYLVKNKL